MTIEVAATRDWTWPSSLGFERARRPGASPPMRMTASWFRIRHDPTEYKFVAR